jgi:hypothetical protein
MKKFSLIFFILILTASLFAEPQIEKLVFLPGSNIYIRIFLFFFPLSNNYETIYSIDDGSLISEIILRKDYIKNEPATPPIFESDLNIRIKDIPLDRSGSFTLPITIRCNKKVNFKKVNFTVYRRNDILILKGQVKDLHIKDISDNEYFKNRFNWNFPLYFDLRYQINR